jgi:N-acetylmuramoyl-L-alanine amidase
VRPDPSGGGEVVGMRLPVLRETKMPAVLCRIGPPDAAVTRSTEVARAIAGAVLAWVTAPVVDA